MKIAAILFAFAVAVAVSYTISLTIDDYAETLKLWEDGDWDVQEIPDHAYLAYSDEQLAQLLPVIAAWIPIQDELEKHSDSSWQAFETPHDWTPFLNALPPDHPIRKRWGLGRVAASVIRELSAHQRMHLESLLPILIEGVADPTYSSTGTYCLNALELLTKIDDPRLTSWSRLKHPQDAKTISRWFQSWHDANDDKPLIISADLENEIRNAFLPLVIFLEKQIPPGEPSSPGGSKKVRPPLPRHVRPLFDIHFQGPIRGANRGQRNIPGWVWVVIRPQTRIQENMHAWERTPPWSTFEMLPAEAQMVHSSPIENSAWSLEIYGNQLTAEESEKLISILKE